MTTNNPKLHLRCKPCTDFLSFVKRIESNGIYISDIPHQTSEEDLYTLFSRFGRIADFYLPDNRSYCLIQFHERHPADQVLHFPIAMYGRELRIRPRFTSKADEQKLAALDEVHDFHEELLKSISEGADFMEQVKEFLNAAEADETELQRQYDVCRDIENALKNISGAYKVVPFGSSTTGLAFKHSDLDLFYGKDVQSNSPDVYDVFRKARIILEKLDLLESFRPIPNARVPIIKFVHKPTGYNCDLSFRNTMGIENSNLIKFLVSVDPRIRPFFMIVKYWAKLHHLTGRRMSNYALIMLMTCFLQSLNEPILPPLCKLQHDGVKEKWVAGWNAGFDDDTTRLRPVSNNLSLEELLSQFFDSVVRTDFLSYVLCPYLGCLFPRGQFYNANKLPRQFNLYIDNVKRGMPYLRTDSPLCLQDPIELNNNITRNVAEHDFQCFRDHCWIAAKLSYAVPPNIFLSKLLSTSFEFSAGNTKRTWLPNPMHLKPLRPYMTLHIPYPENVVDNISWTCDLTKKIILIFKKVLKIFVTDEKKGVDTKPGSDQDLICKGSQVLWIGRDKLWKRWFSKSDNLPASVTSVCIDDDDDNDDVEVLLDTSDTRGTTSTGSNDRKRKRDSEDNSGSKKQKTEPGCSTDGNDVEVAVIELEESDVETPVSRNLKNEINLTNAMVTKGHALPASTFILDFSCKVCRDTNSVRIEISDRRSRNNYFSSLCAFLEDFLNRHATD